MSLQDYINKTYLNSEPANKDQAQRRRRRKGHTASVVDHEEELQQQLAAQQRRRRRDGDDSSDSDATQAQKRSGKTRGDAKRSGWSVVGEAATQGPVLETHEEPEGTGAMMESGARAGLQTAAQVAAQMEKRKRDERARFEESGDAVEGAKVETVYRDATGRRVDVAMRREELRRQQEQEAEARRREKELQGGLVQQREREAARQRLADAHTRGIARYADDADLNEELKARQLRDDPAAAFLTRRNGSGASRRPLYKGFTPPNRFGILAGHRWDGVDRGNGFERKYLQAKNERAHQSAASRAWAQEDM